MSTRDWSKATRESLVALAACYLGPDDDRTQELLEQAADRLRTEVEPKLRTRAEVDAEIVRSVRECITKSLLFPRPELNALCAEPTETCIQCDAGVCSKHQPEPNRVTDHDADQRPEDPNHTGVIQPPAYGPSSVDSSSPSEPAAGATLSEPETYECPKCGPIGRDVTEDAECKRCGRFANVTGEEPEACGCEQSDDLKDKLTECRRLLRAIHGFAKSITELSREIP